MSDAKIICAGFGGQGVMSMGRLIAYTGMLAGKEVSWLPSYGPEMRGGTANCHVIVSDHPIGSPVLVHDATAAIVMNLPSMRKFEQALVPGGTLVVNSSLIDAATGRSDLDVLLVPATAAAGELGSAKVANMVMLGAFVERTGLFTIDEVAEALSKVFGPKKASFMPLNREALHAGARVVTAGAAGR